MIHHPIVIGIKLLLLLATVLVLAVLYAILPPQQFRVAVIVAVVTFVCLVLVLWIVAFKVLSNPDSRLGRQLVLSEEARAEDGYVASSGKLTSLVGERGTAASALRPAGTARFGEKRLSVVTEGEFIQAGAEVEIVSVSGSRVVVRAPRKKD